MQISKKEYNELLNYKKAALEFLNEEDIEDMESARAWYKHDVNEENLMYDEFGNVVESEI